MVIRSVLVVACVLGAGAVALAQTPRYLWAEVAVPAGAVEGLAGRALALSVPVATWVEGQLVVSGALDEDALRAARAYLYTDGDLFLLGMDTAGERVALRGNSVKAELIVWAAACLAPPPDAFFDLARELGLLDREVTISLSMREVPFKLPRAPEGVRLDPTLWALVQHPDWFAAARDFGLERVGLRVRVVAEGSGVLAEALEPYVLSSTEALMDLLVPIGLLAEVGRDPAVTRVRPPLTPHPAGG